MIKRDLLEKQVKTVFLSIGSNLGNRFENIEKSKVALFKCGIKLIKSSNYYETFSWPNPNNPKFYNVVLKIKTDLSALKLLSICKNIEKTMGRRRGPKNSPRVCDIDIIDYGKEISKKGLNLPHSRMHKRNFVLVPLFELEKDWKHPISKRHIKKLIFSLSNKDISSIKQI